MITAAEVAIEGVVDVGEEAEVAEEAVEIEGIIKIRIAGPCEKQESEWAGNYLGDAQRRSMEGLYYQAGYWHALKRGVRIA